MTHRLALVTAVRMPSATPPKVTIRAVEAIPEAAILPQFEARAILVLRCLEQNETANGTDKRLG